QWRVPNDDEVVFSSHFYVPPVDDALETSTHQGTNDSRERGGKNGYAKNNDRNSEESGLGRLWNDVAIAYRAHGNDGVVESGDQIGNRRLELRAEIIDTKGGIEQQHEYGSKRK